MKTKIKYGVLLALTITLLAIGAVHYCYQAEMSNMTIFHHFSTKGDNYASTYLRIIIPEEEYHGEKTLRAIYWYIRSTHGVQNRLTIIIYNSKDELIENQSYAEYVFE